MLASFALNPTIDKFAELPPGSDYAFLCEQGMDYLRQMSGATWTDHNVHDPGIQLLEVICYGLSELGYKCSFAIEDILAEKSQIDSRLLTEKSSTQATDSFFSARDILTNSPVTIIDWRKLVMDCEGIKNAWLLPLALSEPAIYLDHKAEQLSFVANKHTQRLNIDGLYQVELEFEPDTLLGDLNTWRYQFALTGSGEKWLRLFIPPIWQECLQNFPKLQQLNDGYFSPLESIQDTAFYKTELTLISNGLSIKTILHIESPLEKTAANRNFVETRLNSHRDDLLAFIKQKAQRCCGLARKVYKRLHQNRSFCEDFEQIRAREVEDIGLCADIEVSAGADLESVLAQVYWQIQEFLAPSVYFYTLQELQEKGLGSEHIFNGPPLQHGFLLDEEVAAADGKAHVHVSDIIQILMDIPGVVAVKKIQLSAYYLGLLLQQGESWCLPVSDKRSLNFNIERSKIVFYKGLIPYQANQKTALEKLQELKAVQMRGRPRKGRHDLPIPTGQNRHLADYMPLQHEFPLNYGIGPVGLPPSATDLRKAQSKQLKAFLLHLEQLFANFHAQLANIKHLFSLDARVQRSYFAKLLYSLPATYVHNLDTHQKLKDAGWTAAEILLLEPLLGQAGMSEADFLAQLEHLLGTQLLLQRQSQLLEICRLPAFATNDVAHIAPLIKDFVDANTQLDWSNKPEVSQAWQDFVVEQKQTYWDQLLNHDPLLESEQEYQRRRNHMLDHLAARFAERFADYVLLNNQIGQVKTAEQLISDKLAFLQDYPLMSRTRGEGLDYALGDNDQQAFLSNISGLKRRVCRLLGIPNWQHGHIPQDYKRIFEVKQEVDDDDIDEDRFNLRAPNGDYLLTGTKHYLDDDSRRTALASVLRNGLRPSNYAIKQNINDEYYFHLLDEDNDILAMHKTYYPTRGEIEAVIERCIIELQNRATHLEGFHLIEHMLLRPIQATGAQQRLFKISLNEDCSPGFLDPYSFRATAVVPAWPIRFQNMDFRRFFEQSIREEAPAHAHIKICWVDRDDMQAFEQVYFPWLKCKSKQVFQHPDLWSLNDDLVNTQNQLIKVLAQLNSVYPETHLFDCSQNTDDSTVLLNHSKLGSSEGN